MKKSIATLIVYVLVLTGSNAFAGKLTDNGNGTVSDKSEGLMWQQGEGGFQKCQEAITYCDNLFLAGHDD
jgi:hypothetical protein